MNILIITKSLSAKDGQGRYSLGLINELAKRHNLTILTSVSENNFDTQSLKIDVIKIPDLLSIRKNVLKCFKYFSLVKKHLKDKDLVHFFTDLPNYFIFSPLLFFHLKPYYLTFHGTFGIDFLEKGWRKIFLKRFYKRAKKIFCISNFTKNEILKRVKLDNLIVINNGVDFKKFDELYQVLKDKAKKEVHKVVISVGVIKPRKGYEFSLKALAILKDKYRDIKYYIVGEPGSKDYLAGLKKIISEKNLADNIVFLKDISDEELVELYIKSDLLLFTPINHGGVYFEGFGLVCLEAGVCEKPVVGSLNCGVEDAVQDGQTGYLVPQKEPEKIARAADKILSDKNLAQKMGAANRKFAASLDWSQVVKNYERYYK